MRIERFISSTVRAVSHHRGDQEGRQDPDLIGQLESEDGTGQRRSHRAAQRRGHADQGPERRVAAGQERGDHRTQRTPMISSGASTPPEVPEPSAIDQITPLTTISPTNADGT